MKTEAELLEQLDAVELLGEPVRRALYLHVARQPGEVSRDQAAAAVNVSRELAAFHLDKLVGAGLLEPVFRRLTGRTGPGAGRPAKLYRRAAAQVDISLPHREYQLAARILARALDLRPGQKSDEELDRAAREQGVQLGRWGKARGLDLLELLEAQGYEPFEAEAGRVRLRNCPFHALQAEFKEPVCGMNLAFLDGVRAGAGARTRPEFEDPAGGHCCVSFRFPR
ncbi:MAG TPA: helix-turn-helix domain-containing protein [Candidatus Dormibacteraeota bacterium]